MVKLGQLIQEGNNMRIERARSLKQDNLETHPNYAGIYEKVVDQVSKLFGEKW